MAKSKKNRSKRSKVKSKCPAKITFSKEKSGLRVQPSAVNHPLHYGGKASQYEAIKVIEAWGLDFHLGNTVKYINRAGKKDVNTEIQDLEKAQWYLQRKINNLKMMKEA